MKSLLLSLLLCVVTQAAEYGIASHYSVRSNGGRHTASGEKLDDASMTAAHKHLPFGTKVRVTHLKTGKSVVVRVNNRGPFVKGRVIDLTRDAAKALGFYKNGIARVKVEVVKKP